MEWVDFMNKYYCTYVNTVLYCPVYTMQVSSRQHMQGVRVSGGLDDHCFMHVYFVWIYLNTVFPLHFARSECIWWTWWPSMRASSVQLLPSLWPAPHRPSSTRTTQIWYIYSSNTSNYYTLLHIHTDPHLLVSAQTSCFPGHSLRAPLQMIPQLPVMLALCKLMLILLLLPLLLLLFQLSPFQLPRVIICGLSLYCSVLVLRRCYAPEQKFY